MAETHAATGLPGVIGGTPGRILRRVLGNARFVVIVSVVLISGTFASAAVIQMRLDRERALGAAAAFESRQAASLAAAVSDSIDRLVALAHGFAGNSLDAESAAALAEAGGRALQNVSVIDARGHVLSDMKQAPGGLLSLPGSGAALPANGTIGVSDDARSLLVYLTLPGKHIAVVQLALDALLPSAPDGLIALPTGRLLVLGRNWRDLPDVAALQLSDANSATRILEMSKGARLVSLARAGNWPLVVGASVEIGRALNAWYGALPLYLFLIFGPALAGAGLAAVFVREFERRLKTADAMKALRSTRAEEARLLVRLADAERRAIAAERAKSEFMSHMSHELRTPLNAIIGFAGLMEEGTDSGHTKCGEYARDIAQAGRQLHTRIGDILEFADLDARRRSLARDRVDASVLAQERVAAFRTDAEARGIALSLNAGEQFWARGDRFAIGRILDAVLGNALGFTPRGGAVSMSVTRMEDSIVVTVRDNGTGFSDDELAKAGESFRPFERPGRDKGLGLGLASAITLARRMGGSLRIESAQGKGTLVELRLPGAVPA